MSPVPRAALDVTHGGEDLGAEIEPRGVVVAQAVRGLELAQLVDGGLEQVAHVGRDRRPLLVGLGGRREERKLGTVVGADRVDLRAKLVLGLPSSSPPQAPASPRRRATDERGESGSHAEEL